MGRLVLGICPDLLDADVFCFFLGRGGGLDVYLSWPCIDAADLEDGRGLVNFVDLNEL